MRQILIAPNAFKNSLSAQAVAEAIQRGLLNSKLVCTCTCFPVADGGDGTGELIMQKCNGVRYEAIVKDPIGRDIKAAYGIINNGDACLIEMAGASGLRLLKTTELNPLRATSFGTGQLIKSALDKGVRSFILCMGGSATVDGGCGILSALGIRFLDSEGNELTDLPERLVDLEAIDFSKLDERILSCEITVLCDVDNKLLGVDGAAAVFGPQKGASPDNVKKLEQALTKLTEITLQQTGIDLASIAFGGTAGGAAAGLHGIINARLVNGIKYFLDITAFDTALQKASIVITGEGSIDDQTLQGKAPFGVAFRAKELGRPVIALAGKVPLVKSPGLAAYFDVLLAIGQEPMELETAMAATAQNLERTALELGNMLALNLS